MSNRYLALCVGSMTILSAFLTVGCEKKSAEILQNCDKKIEEKNNYELENVIKSLTCNYSYDKKTLNILKKYADNGNSKAQNFLALWYGSAIESDEKLVSEACKYAQKLIDQNNPYGYYLLGCHYLKKYENEDYYVEGNFQLAADKGVPEAALMKAIISQKDSAESEKYFKLAIKNNNKTAIHHYAWFLVEQKRYDEAIKLLETANDCRSLDLLSLCYHNGWGVPVDSKKAFEYANKSLDAPDVCRFFSGRFIRAFHNVSTIYEIGLEEYALNGKTDFYEQCLKISAEYVTYRYWSNAHDSELQYGCYLLLKEDWLKGISYLERAAAKNDIWAAYILGSEYFKKKDYKNAEKYLLHAFSNNIFRKDIIGKLTYIYILNADIRGKYFAALGHELEITICRDYDAMFIMRNSGDEGMAKAAALFSLSAKEGSNFAKDMLKDIFKNYLKQLETIGKKGNADAVFALAEYYMKNDKNSPEYKKGVEYFEKAVNMEHTIACYILANIYARGLENQQKNLQEAMKYYKIAAAKGFKPATKNIAFLLANEPEFANTSVDEIKYWYEVSTFQDEEEMYFFWGKVFENIVKDEKFAEELYRKGAKKNDPDCIIAMYILLNNRKSDEAQNFLNQAMECKLWKGYMFYGLKIEKDFPRKAYINYLESYYTNSNPLNAEKIVQCLFEGIGCKADNKKAIKFAEHAIKNGDINMYTVLGNAFREGKFVKKDLKKAKEYYIKGAAAGNPDCKAALEKFNNIKL